MNSRIWKLKRSLTNNLRELHTSGWRSMRPLIGIANIAILAFAVFVLAGGVYVIIEKPLAILPQATTGGWTFVYPGTVQEQSMNEAVVSAIIYLLGLGGLYMILRSTRLAYRPRQAYLLLILGLTITLFAIFYAGSLLSTKIS